METLDAGGIAPEPLPSEPVRPNIARARCVGVVRLPLAGPYRPSARLLVLEDGRSVFLVRLWERDRAVPRLLEIAVVRRWAVASGLAALVAAIDALTDRAQRRSRT